MISSQRQGSGAQQTRLRSLSGGSWRSWLVLVVLALGPQIAFGGIPRTGTEILDEGIGDVGQYTSIARDLQGHLHLSYHDAVDEDLVYAYEESPGQWAIEHVDVAGHVGWFTSLALDSLDQPHIVYFSLEEHEIRYASKSGGSWSIHVVDGPDPWGGANGGAVAIDGDGNPHIAYEYFSTETEIRYARRIAGVWTVETVDTLTESVGDVSIGINSNGIVYVAYGGDGNVLRVARRVGTWQKATIDSGNVAFYVSLAVDDSNDVHVAYARTLGASLRCASDVGGTWNVSTVDPAAGSGVFCRITIGPGGPEIAYVDWSSKTLRRAVSNGGTWSLETVDPTPRTGEWPSIVSDGFGVAVSHHNDGVGTLDLARFEGAEWTHEKIDESGKTGWASNLALTTDGRPGIAYQEQREHDLRYAEFDGSEWHFTTVDTTGNAGTVTAVAFDSQNRPAIAHYNSNSGDLRFTSYDAFWLHQIVDSGTAAVGSALDLTFDEEDRPRIAYREAIDGQLRYAWRDAGAWLRSTVDASGDCGLEPRITMVGTIPHILYACRNGTLLELKHAWRVGSTWNLEVLDTNDAGWGLEVTSDSNGGLHASYVRATDEELRYAFFDGTTWTFEQVALGVALGAPQTSIAVGPGGDPWIAYGSLTSDDLFLAVRQGGVWCQGVADSGGIPGGYPSLGMDDLGQLHLAHFGRTDADLLYTRADASVSVGYGTIGDEATRRDLSTVAVVPNPMTLGTPGRIQLSSTEHLESERRSGAEHVRIRILDTSGRIVRTLQIDPRTPLSDLQWDGRGDNGRPVSSGAYFVSVGIAGATRATGRVMVIH